jgi:PHD/YefM family antitoxin component YafN of YafNO toxin-antitoxin module
MPAIFPSVALKNRQREIKRIADSEPVYITENGHGKYVFVSAEVFEQMLSDAAQEALYEERMARALSESRDDFASGRTYGSRDELLAAVERKRAGRAKA